MKTTIKLDGRPMVLVNNHEGKAHVSSDAPHSAYAATRHDVHAELAAFKNVCSMIGPVSSVVELFGGSGWHARYIQEANKPRHHLCLDISSDCTESVKASFDSSKVRAACVDTYAWLSRTTTRWEWCHADFNQYTYQRQAKEPYKSAIPRIFELSARWVTITDSAAFGLVRFERNRVSYAKLLGMDPNDWKDYYRALAEKFSADYGYGMLGVWIWHRMAAMMVFEKGAAPQPAFVKEEKNKAEVVVVAEGH